MTLKALAGGIALMALIAGTAMAARDPEDGPGPLPWRVGGRLGFTADAAAFPDSDGLVVEIYVRVPPATIAALAPGADKKARLRLTARIRDVYGGSKGSTTEDFEIDPPDTSQGFGKVVVLRFPTRAGGQRLQLKLEDLQSRKRGLAYIGRKVTQVSSVEGDFEIPKPQAGRDLSDVEFVWSEQAPETSELFRRAGQSRLPNPERLYGLYATRLRAFFEARSGPADERPWHWVARIVDGKDQMLAQQEGQGVSGRRLAAAISIDLAGKPAGGYQLEIKAWQEGDTGALMRRAPFSLAWQPDFWLLDPERIADVVHLLLPTAMEDTFAVMHPGEQEAFMNEFWRVRDPDPDTPRNEAREEFMQRVELANQRFHGLGEGVMSDMGRVYARYGEPSEILRQVVPSGDNTLLQALQDLQLTEDRPLGEVHQKGPGGDMRPFEIWIYEGDIPLPPEADPAVGRTLRRKRIVFLFVDQIGTGDYIMRYSTE